MACTGANRTCRATSWLIAVLVAAALLRVALAFTTPPVAYPDSGGYFDLGRALVAGDLSGDPGMRTPVYPLLIALLGFNAEAVRVAQNLMGLAGTALLFYSAFLLSRRGWVAALVASAYGLSLGQVWFENALLTEATTAFLVTCVATALTYILVRSGQPLAYVALGLASGLVTLGRPQYVALPLVVIGALLLIRTRPRFVVIVAILALGPVLAWSAFNQARFGMFAPTTLGGYNLMNHAGYYMEDAPDRYATIRDIFVREKQARGGDASSVVWFALPEIQRETGLSNAELSRTLSRLGVELLVTHPVPYLKRALGDVVRFWSGYRWQFGTQGPELRSAVVASVVERWLLFVVFGLTWVAATLVGIGRSVAARRNGATVAPEVRLLLVLLALTIAAALPAAFIEHGDAGRYGLPLQPVAALMTLLVVQLTRRSLPANDA